VNLSLKCNKETLEVLKDDLYAKFISYDDYLVIKSEAKENEAKVTAMMDTVRNDFAATKKDLNGRILV